MSVTLTGEVERVTYENEGTSFRVLRVGSLEGDGAPPGPIAVVGTFQAVGPGVRVRVTGRFVVDPRHGQQLRADVLVPIEPNTLVGLERYLGSGMIPGVGPALAKRVVQTFELETLRVLDREPQRLAEVPGLGKKRIAEIQTRWASERALGSVLLALESHGASHGLAIRIWKHYGDEAASVVQRSPYRLALEVRGVGFKTADRLARSLGISDDHPERCQAGVMHVLDELAEAGHVCAPRSALTDRAAELLGVDQSHVVSAIDALWASGRVAIREDAVYLARLERAEAEVASWVLANISSGNQPVLAVDEALRALEQNSRIELAPSQRRAIETAAREKLSVITGGPGVGKTTIVRALIDVFQRGGQRVALAAPTGRAAKRLSEATGREALTLHRLLEIDPRTGAFQRGAKHRLDADVVIVDEASMLDLELSAALLLALPRAARLVLVGDADQLPSVGPGAVLRDLIDSRVVPVLRLTEIFRQARQSGIVQNAHRILHGEAPVSADGEDPKADFFVIARTQPEQAAELIQDLVTRRIPRRFGLDPKREIQVLAPMHRGPAGTLALNQLLQQALNPGAEGLAVRGQRLSPGDKVMQTRNDYQNDVFNGDVGVVVHADAERGRLSVRFEQGEVEYDETNREALTLAYAMSVHKSQGSEYPAVIVPLLTTHFVMLSRHLLYTAVTRARRLCVLVADPRALRMALQNARRDERKTGLSERLRGLEPGPPPGLEVSPDPAS